MLDIFQFQSVYKIVYFPFFKYFKIQIFSIYYIKISISKLNFVLFFNFEFEYFQIRNFQFDRILKF